MKRLAGILLLFALTCLGGSLAWSFLGKSSTGNIQANETRTPRETRLRTVDDYLQAITDWSGTHVVFDSADLPTGKYHDIMTALTESEKLEAARIALREFKKYPRGYLGKIGIKGIGIFKVCASRHNDGFHSYDEGVKGYRFYGIWNGKNGIAAAFYSNQQLPLTLHHEIFHHVDATRDGKTDYEANFQHDDIIKEIQAGKTPYSSVRIAADDLAALKKAARGEVLESSVSEYCKKSPGEDKAETARWFMSHLADALIQISTRPELSGSQRMLHVLSKYESSVDGAPGLDWFLDLALGRNKVAQAEPPPAATDNDGVGARLHQLAAGRETTFRSPRADSDQVRKLLNEAAQLPRLEGEPANQLMRDASTVVHGLLRARIEPTLQDRNFTIHGNEDRTGGNQTLRQDIAQVGNDAATLRSIAGLTAQQSSDVFLATQLRDLRLLARYRTYIASKWSVSQGTQQVFDQARDQIVATLPADQAALIATLKGLSWKELGERLSAEGALSSLERGPDAGNRLSGKQPQENRDNPYIAKVDQAVSDPVVRAAIRRVQPACLRVDHGSAVCVNAQGYAITCAHVARSKGNQLTARFPDGRNFSSTCIAIDRHLDLALLKLDSQDAALPFAPLAACPPEVGTRVVCIGQPGGSTPSGGATSYQPFHVSTGQIRGFLDDPLGDQSLGRTKHDAWTYWGHSGSPLFDEAGQIVALHNSWDSKTAMRHAITYQAIVSFLKAQNIDFEMGR